MRLKRKSLACNRALSNPCLGIIGLLFSFPARDAEIFEAREPA